MALVFNPFTGNFDNVMASSSDMSFSGGSLNVNGDITLDSGGTFTTTVQAVTPTANRTISFPDQTGTVGLVSGATGNIQYNNAGQLAGTGDLNTELDWVSPTGTYTALKVNADSNSGNTGTLLDLQVDGSSKCSVNSAGDFIGAGVTLAGTAFAARTNTGSVGLYSGGSFGFSSVGGVTSSTLTLDTVLRRDAANTFAQRNGTNAQTYRLYNTYTSSTDYARGYLTFSGQELQIGTERQTQTAAQAVRLKTTNATEPIYLSPGGFNFFSVDSTNQVRTGLPINMAAAYTFGTLPTGAVGYMTRITDGDAGLTPGTVLSVSNTGNGTNTPYLCWYNGTNWTVIGV